MTPTKAGCTPRSLYVSLRPRTAVGVPKTIRGDKAQDLVTSAEVWTMPVM